MKKLPQYVAVHVSAGLLEFASQRELSCYVKYLADVGMKKTNRERAKALARFGWELYMRLRD